MDSQKFFKWVSAKIEGLAMGVFFHSESMTDKEKFLAGQFKPVATVYKGMM
jgi:hypothetical protein